MFKDIDPMIPTVLGCLLVGGAIAYSNPNTRAMFSQRQQAQQLQEAARIETRNSEAMKAIAATRTGCTRVAQISPLAVYQLAPGTAICDHRYSAIIGTDQRPTLLAQEVE